MAKSIIATGVIYLITNSVNGKPYVGKAKHSADKRWESHCRGARKGSQFLLAKAIRKYGESAFTRQVLATQVPYTELDSMERIWIFLMNSQAPKGYNMTSGGDGIIDPCKEIRKKMSTIAKKRCETPERRAELGRYSRDAWTTPGYKEAWLESRKSLNESEEYRAKLRARNARCNADPEYHRKLKDGHKKNYEDPAFRAKMLESVRRPEVRTKISNTVKEQAKDPAVRARLSKQAKEQWNDPEFRRRQTITNGQSHPGKAAARWLKAHVKIPLV